MRIALMIGGGILAVSCVTIFTIRGKGTPAAFDPPKEFVVVGPYKYVRNPMYIGGFFMLLGFAFFNQSPTMVVFSLLALVLIHCFVVLVEEKGLEHRFGSVYFEYKRTVNRWLPTTPRRT